ncbi:class I SAM-dependent methyltransferase [Paenibacillus odorifer]|uniref:class I SAM-dependent methyltransferase n=1 Tax=Paenibacillus odorifer TaxID=189426 RepID=UPI00096CEC38|nr:class I SAM-dependent methyltransferase [Paenibacillus odorifer]OME27316.1 methylase [Paenibacillus odorifer]
MTDEQKLNAKRATYEKTTRISIPSYDSLFSMIQSYFRFELGDIPVSLLVVGAGGGNEFSAWGPSNPNWTFTGVDPSEDMLKIAKLKIDELGLESRVSLIPGTIDDLPQQDSKFDVASCILVLHFIHDVQEKLKLLRSIKDNLKPGAPFVLVSAYRDLDDPELHDRINVWKSFWVAGYESPEAFDNVSSNITKISFLPEKQIEELLKESGFTRITRFYSTGIMAGWMCHAG